MAQKAEVPLYIKIKRSGTSFHPLPELNVLHITKDYYILIMQTCGPWFNFQASGHNMIYELLPLNMKFNRGNVFIWICSPINIGEGLQLHHWRRHFINSFPSIWMTWLHPLVLLITRFLFQNKFAPDLSALIPPRHGQFYIILLMFTGFNYLTDEAALVRSMKPWIISEKPRCYQTAFEVYYLAWCTFELLNCPKVFKPDMNKQY